MRIPIVLLAAAAAASSVQAQTIYSETFSGAVGGEWSHTTTSITPTGARPFLGQFGATTVTLSLSGLPAHSDVTVSLDLFVIRTWDGNGLGPGDEDRFRVSLGDGGTQTVVSDKSLSNTHLSQSHPDSLTSGLTHPARTGAAESNSLGYGGDTVYHLDFTLPHTATTLSAQFQGILNQAIGDESWGIDNVQVSVSAVPEPGEYAMAFGVGLAGLALWRRRSRRSDRGVALTA